LKRVAAGDDAYVVVTGVEVMDPDPVQLGERPSRGDGLIDEPRSGSRIPARVSSLVMTVSITAAITQVWRCGLRSDQIARPATTAGSLLTCRACRA
jgi:hypothetical protein